MAYFSFVFCTLLHSFCFFWPWSLLLVELLFSIFIHQSTGAECCVSLKPLTSRTCCHFLKMLFPRNLAPPFTIFSVKVLAAQLRAILWDPMDCSPPGSPVHRIAISFSRGSSQPRDWTRVSCIAGRYLTLWATREALWLPPTYVGPAAFKGDWHTWKAAVGRPGWFMRLAAGPAPPPVSGDTQARVEACFAGVS